MRASIHMTLALAGWTSVMIRAMLLKTRKTRMFLVHL